MTCRPSWSGSLAVEFELASDGFFDVGSGAFVVLCELIHGLSGLIALGDERSWDAGPYQDRAAAGNVRVDNDRTWLIRRVLAREGIQAHWLATVTPFDALEVRCKHLPHGME